MPNSTKVIRIFDGGVGVWWDEEEGWEETGIKYIMVVLVVWFKQK